MEVHTLHFKSIDSTHAWAKAHVEEFDLNKMTCITADIQTKGRGRFTNRSWISIEGNLHMTLFFGLPLNSPLLPNLAQLLAFSCVRFLRKKDLDVQIKWPNDLMHQDKKLGGVLAETLPLKDHVGVFLGLGLNVNAPVELDHDTTSLFEITEKKWDLKALRDGIIVYFQEDQKKGFHKEDFEPVLAYLGKTIQCQVGDKTLEGIFVGLSENGYLQLKLPDDTITEIFSGEIMNLS